MLSQTMTMTLALAVVLAVPMVGPASESGNFEEALPLTDPRGPAEQPSHQVGTAQPGTMTDQVPSSVAGRVTRQTQRIASAPLTDDAPGPDPRPLPRPTSGFVPLPITARDAPPAAPLTSSAGTVGETESLPAADRQPTVVAAPPIEAESTVPAESVPAPAPSGAEGQVIDATPVLSVETLGPNEINVGRPAICIITVRNLGQTPAEDVRIRATLPAHAELRRAQPRPVTQQDRVVVFAMGQLPAEAKREIRLELLPRQALPLDLSTSATFSMAPRAAAPVRNRRSMLGVAAYGPRENYVNRDGFYGIRVSNTGESAARDVRVVAVLPRGLHMTVVDRAVDFSARDNRVTWRLPIIRPGTTEVLQFKARALAAGTHTQRVAVLADGGLEADCQHETTAGPIAALR
jgi:hypothetical protein